jgi:pyrroline-5-carboxylate reductase
MAQAIRYVISSYPFTGWLAPFRLYSTTIMALKLGFLGAGQMGSALAVGAVNGKLCASSEIMLCDTSVDQLAKVKSLLPGCVTVNEPSDLFEKCHQIVIAIKPQVLPQVSQQLKSLITTKHTLISIVAGISLAKLEQWFAPAKIIRVMPNTPAQVSQGASAIASNLALDSIELQAAVKLFETVGSVVHVSDTQMDAVTGLSGSGPAYVLLLIEAMIDAGVANGLARSVATTLAVQTVLGTASMVAQTNQHPATLKDQVTSPGGTTIAGLRVLEAKAFRGTIIEAISAATSRSKELGTS